MPLDPEQAYAELYEYCRRRDFAGHDPFDGLSSRVFQLTALRHWRPARLAWLQMVKRSPLDLRNAVGVPAGVNPKGLALFALAELSRSRVSENEDHAENARNLVDRLLRTGIITASDDGQSVLAFGYNFDWQSRSFYAPIGTPAIVPTAFANQALIEAYEAIGDYSYLNAADETCRFILSGLNRPVETDREVCFSYTPVDRSVIFNASLLAGESLARVGSITANDEYMAMAAKTVRFAIDRQRNDGAWGYGESNNQGWVDNFHTAYILLSLYRISSLIPDLRAGSYDAIKRGSEFWLGNFFLDDGTPKYYDNAVYPVDIHSAAVAITALSELRAIDERMLPLAVKVAQWTVTNMGASGGYFYYQVRKNRTIKTPFMRWGQAWMAYALARLIEAQREY